MRGRSRRAIFVLISVIVLSSSLIMVERLYDAETFRGEFFSGWAVLLLIISLLLLGVRKKFSMLPLGRVYIWVRLHICIGLIASIVFFFHVGEIWPSGLFEKILLITFALAFVSGFIAIVLNRWLPPIMRRRGERIFISRIKPFQNSLREKARELVVNAVSEGAGRNFVNFYSCRLEPHFNEVRDVQFHLLGSSEPYRRWDAEFKEVDGYSNDSEKFVLLELRQLLRQKIDLDFQYIMQVVLKSMLIFHVTISNIVLLIALVHLCLIYGFVGA